MKKFLFILFGVFAFSGAFAAGENVPTSKSYVDAAVATKQDIIPANDGAARVLTNTGTAGEYGTRGIYDANGEYAAQTQNLVDAATMNAGVQNAINSEFQCIEWLDPNDHSSDCLLMDVFGTPTQQILPNGFTALEYIESTGTQWIDTRIIPTLNTGVFLKAALTKHRTGFDHILLGATNTNAFLNGSAFSIDVFLNSVALPHGGVNNTGYNGNHITIQNTLNRIYDFKLNYLNDGLARVDNLQRQLAYSNNMTTKSVYLFNLNTSSGGLSSFATIGAKIYNVIFTENNNIIANFYPARRDSDGEIGMYDTVTNTFFTNAGTGEFIAGPVANLYIPAGG